MPTGRESKWGTSLPPVSISCQVCSPDIDYVQGSTLRKIEYHRVNITLSYEWRSEAKFNQGKGRPTFPDAESSYSNLAILMEQEKFSDDMDPQEMSENLQFLRRWKKGAPER
ncbi:hypothetical protein SO802_035031 [Lithocarpus litseifolius]|uniref:Uncharacterized protein n=1 Tax=Lithocarpus litseifolius TaxID=425828 RepID=A0AAW2BAM0_9ROSI